MKLIWKVGAVPMGRYRSFQERSWPNANFDSADGEVAASIGANKGYHPTYRKMDDVGFDLEIRITVPTDNNRWEWRTLKKRARSLKEAKGLAAAFYKENPNFIRA